MRIYNPRNDVMIKKMNDYLFTSHKGNERMDIDYAFDILQSIGIVHWNEMDMSEKMNREHFYFLPTKILEVLMWDLERVCSSSTEQEDGQLLHYVERLLNSGYDLAGVDSELGNEIFLTILRDLDNIAIAKSTNILIEHGVFPTNGGWNMAVERYQSLCNKGKSELYLKAYSEAIMNWWKAAVEKRRTIEYHEMSFKQFVQTKEYERMPILFFTRTAQDDILADIFNLFDRIKKFQDYVAILKSERAFLEQHFPEKYSSESRKHFWDLLISSYTLLGEKLPEKEIEFSVRYILFLAAYCFQESTIAEVDELAEILSLTGTNYNYKISEITYLLEYLNKEVTQREFDKALEMVEHGKKTVLNEKTLMHLYTLQEILDESGIADKDKYGLPGKKNRELLETFKGKEENERREALDGAKDFLVDVTVSFSTFYNTENCKLCGKHIEMDQISKIDKYKVFHCPFCNGKLHLVENVHCEFY